jgi:hypothetical protein
LIDFFVLEVVLNVSFSFLNVSFNSETAELAEATFLVNQIGENLNNIISDTTNKVKNIRKTGDFHTRGSNIKNRLNVAIYSYLNPQIKVTIEKK